MTHHNLSLMLLQLAIMLAVALLAGTVARKLGQPRIIGELLGGILLGPTIFGALLPHAHDTLFPKLTAISSGRDAIVKLGLLLFMYIAGRQVHLTHLQRLGSRVALTSLAGVVLPFSMGFACVFFVPDLWRTHTQGSPMLLALFMGTALAISALPVIARILMDLNLLDSDMGNIVMAAATIDDLLGWSLFAVILGSFETGGGATSSPMLPFLMVLGASAAILIVARLLGQRAVGWWEKSRGQRPEFYIGLIGVLVLTAAAITESTGSDSVLGAFLIGVALSKPSEQEHALDRTIEQFVMSLLAPLYFVSIGLNVNFASHFDAAIVSVVLVIACVGKIAGASLGAWLGRMPGRQALAIGFGMNARGAMGIILASVALTHQLIDQTVFVALVIMSLVTSVMSGPVMLKLLAQRAEAAELA